MQSEKLQIGKEGSWMQHIGDEFIGFKLKGKSKYVLFSMKDRAYNSSDNITPCLALDDFEYKENVWVFPLNVESNKRLH